MEENALHCDKLQGQRRKIFPFSYPHHSYRHISKKHKPTELLKREDDEPVDDVDIEIYKEEIKQFVQRKMNLQRNMEKSYGLVWGQCFTALQSFVKDVSGFEERSAAFGIIWLLTKKATSGIDKKANAWVNMHNALVILYKMK